MTRGVIGCVLAAAVVAACTAPAEPEALVVGDAGPPETCVACESCPLECDAEAAWVCPSGACTRYGTCACDPATAAADCPSTGCCDVVVDDHGEPILDDTGAAIHECVAPGCTTDDDCLDGMRCVAGATCGATTCGCPDGYGPDPEQPCCLVTNAEGLCCDRGEVDPDTGMCTCTDPLMVDDGGGCACPAGMSPEGADGACICDDPDAVFEPELGTCGCAPGTVLDVDPYTGDTACLDDDDDPIECADPHAVVDPDTGACGCEPGFVEGDTLETVSGQCVPATCGDDVCQDAESCELCSYDCGACDDDDDDDDGVDAAMPDARVPHDAAPLSDAMPPVPLDAVICHLPSDRERSHLECDTSADVAPK